MHIVKRHGHLEKYDQRKVYASVYAACMALRMSQEEAELIASKVHHSVNESLKDKEMTTSEHIFNLVHENLNLLNPDAGYLYFSHRQI